MSDAPPAQPADFDVLLDGLEWGVGRRPTIATGSGTTPVVAEAERCRGCGLCAAVCPRACLTSRGGFRNGAAGRCLRCFDCVEACPQDALRPRRSETSATHSRVIMNRPGWLSRLCGGSGPILPAPFPPSFLLPKPGPRRKPRWVLGLSVATMQEHAVALLERGKVVGAVEEERLNRVRHYGWKPKNRRESL